MLLLAGPDIADILHSMVTNANAAHVHASLRFVDIIKINVKIAAGERLVCEERFTCIAIVGDCR